MMLAFGFIEEHKFVEKIDGIMVLRLVFTDLFFLNFGFKSNGVSLHFYRKMPVYCKK
jgi:hypothetical protein